MRSVEVEGDSIDDAIQKALAELGIQRDRAAIEILSDASRGLLGFGGRKARVRATVRAPLSASFATREEQPEPARVSRGTSAPDPALRVSQEPRAPRPGLATNIDGGPAAVVARRVQRGDAAATPPAAGDLASHARGTLLELLSHLDADCDVAVALAADGAVSLTIRGESSALLIGKRGQTLDAIEYVLNRMLVREAGSTARIEVDVEGYRARREESLVSLARRMADKVRQTGRPATVDLMSPRDRRVVHMTLKDEGGVTSRSQGEGFLRKLIILPTGKRRGGTRPARDGE